MKTVITLSIVWLSICTTHGQQITEKRMSFSGNETIDLNIRIADSIRLQTWDKNEVFVTASVKINDNKDNEAYLISFKDEGNVIAIDANFREDYFKGRNNCCDEETDIYWQIYIPERAVFSMESINADITITGKTEEMKVKSISGFIDLSFPERQSADIEFSTITGTIYSNHTLAMPDMNRGSRAVIKEKLNNGGPLIDLETISGDIFFRKSG